MMQILPTEVIPDSAGSTLDYLVRRTSETIGMQADRAEAIVVGTVEETGGRSVDVRVENISSLRPWFSGEAGPVPKLLIYQTRVKVEQWLKGPGEPASIDIVYVPRWVPRDSALLPLFDPHDRGLLCLRTMPLGLPYCTYVPERSYQLALGEKGMRKFEATDGDNQDHLPASNIEPTANEIAAAIRWYLALPKGDMARRQESLFEALSERNPHIVHHAIRELAQTSAPGMAQRATQMLMSATEGLRVELMLGLWLIGEREAAMQVLEQEFLVGKDTWLARWGLRSSSKGTAEPMGSLVGPAALSGSEP